MYYTRWMRSTKFFVKAWSALQSYLFCCMVMCTASADVVNADRWSSKTKLDGALSLQALQRSLITQQQMALLICLFHFIQQFELFLKLKRFSLGTAYFVSQFDVFKHNIKDPRFFFTIIISSYLVLICPTG